GCLSYLDALLHRLPRQPQANGADSLRHVDRDRLDFTLSCGHRYPPPRPPQGGGCRGRGCCLPISTSCALIATLPSSSLPSGSSTPVPHRLVGDQYASNGPGDASGGCNTAREIGPNGDAFQENCPAR